ncbi:hypothetical protein DL93DRAFT_2086927 [Clavulina sp. PMI_390]|nr:hypothetical protein DL93DRAFT_2086927 [Clavulina sp. PMI_390]
MAGTQSAGYILPKCHGVVFDFACPQQRDPDIKLITLYEVILAMKAVSFVAPRYQFASTNCWWWAQSVLLLLLRLRRSGDPSLHKVQELEKFFERVENPKIIMQYPQYLRVNIVLNEDLIMGDTTKALEQYRALVRLLSCGRAASCTPGRRSMLDLRYLAMLTQFPLFPF